ncbi:response regulator [Clostridium sp. D53t1_180928_C8]|uniref:response regulator n=1 Tax=Clostridium sp. D53t1_180928_C8 TaxID=2787101 RepID=UPI0018AB711E|nr:response regulator [Clostridium sp. D53t1_180928_C8]
MNNNTMILVVEDEKAIRNFIRISLDTQGYRVIESSTGNEAMALTMSYNPELIILDLGLPDIDGIEVIRKVREFKDTPIIIVSARGQDRDKIDALDLGADDYLSKPFSMGELLARVRVLLRRAGRNKEDLEIVRNYSIDGLEVDLEKRRITIQGEEVHFTPIEFKIFALLVKHAGKVLTHNYIIKEVWGGVIGGENQSLRVFMANIRRKIEKEPANPRFLLTEVGVGYRLVDE